MNILKHKRTLIVAVVLCFFSSTAIAQSIPLDANPDTLSWIKRLALKMEKRQAQKDRQAREGKWIISPVIGPGYTPELGFSIAGGVLTSFTTSPSDTLLQRSSLPMTLGISTTGAVFFSGKLTSYWLQDKLRLYGDFWFKNMPDNYFGIGYDNGKSTPKSNDSTAYDRMWFQINPRVLWQFEKNFFVGANIDFNYTKGKDESYGVANDADYITYNDQPFNSGLGLILQYDSRDLAVNAYHGIFAEVAASFYGSYLGGQNSYQVYSIDFRDYVPLFKPGQLLAVQVRGRFAMNDVPYGEMSELGSPFDLRGYYWGQYRDKSMLFFIGEYRHKFYKQNGKPSKHGLVAWVGGGSIGESPADFTNWLPNGGIGYRLEVQPRMNIRLDFGVGKDAYGFYFNFNEAF